MAMQHSANVYITNNSAVVDEMTGWSGIFVILNDPLARDRNGDRAPAALLYRGIR